MGDLPTPKLGRRIATFGAGRAQEKGREALANDVDELGCGADDVIKLIKEALRESGVLRRRPFRWERRAGEARARAPVAPERAMVAGYHRAQRAGADEPCLASTHLRQRDDELCEPVG